MKKSTIFIVIALLCLKIQVYAIDTKDVKPLKIGDSIPQELMSLSLQDQIHDKSFRLQSFNKRVIILDFWGRYCAPCIKALPEYDLINSGNTNSVKIIGISDFNDNRTLISTLKRFEIKLEHTPTLLSNELLNAYFPHKILPHSVWILDGKVVAITAGEYIEQKNISKILNSAGFVLPGKTEASDINPESLLSFAEKKENSPRQLYFSAFSSYIPGISPPARILTDKDAGTLTYSFFNAGILSYCRLALDNKLVGERSEFDLEVGDSSRYLYDKKGYYREWAKENTYCYTVMMPLNFTEEEKRAFLEADLKRWLGLLHVEFGKKSGNKDNPVKYWIKESKGNDGKVNRGTGK